MKVLIISKDGDGLGVAHRLAAQGQDVFLFIQNRKYEKAGVGIVKRVKEWRPILPVVDMVICDMVGMGHLETIFQREKKPFVACSPVLDVMELERSKGMDLFRAAGIDIPETWHFKSVGEAKAALKGMDWQDGVVLKPDGNKGNEQTMLLKEEGELEWALTHLKGVSSLLVQRVVKGIEISTEGWFNGRNFIQPFNHTFEEKRFLHSDLGPNTGCMGNVVISAQSNKLTKHTVERLGKALSKVSYRGPVDINCIVNENKAYALEATARMGYDAIEALLEGLEEPAIDLFFETAIGTKKTMALTKDTMIAVRLSIPPWPHANTKGEEYGEPIFGINEHNLKHIFLCDIYREGDKYFTAGAEGILLKATAVGKRDGTEVVREARARVYRTLENIKVGGKQYRTDIGSRVNKDYKQLREWGWI